MHTPEQIKQTLNRLNSALDTQEVATYQVAEIVQVATVVGKTQPKKNQVEDKPVKKINISIPIPTIDLTHLEEEEGRTSPVPVTIETGHDFQNLTNCSNGNISSPLPWPQYSCQPDPSSSAILISSIMALSSFSDGSVVTPFMIKLYHNATFLPESIIPVSMDMPIPSSVVSPVFKTPLHIPSFSLVSSHVAEKITTVSPSSLLKDTTVQIYSVEVSVHDISSAPEVTLA